MPSLNNNHTILFIASIALLGVVSVSPRAQAPASASAPTFTHDIAPILYTNCVECHRAGEIAPMSLITYAEVRPWAKGIVRQVSDGVMPPWHADAPHGTFRNERGLTAAQKDLIERWAAADAPEGNPADLPPVPTFTSGWGIGQPDAIFEMQEDYPVPANGTIEYRALLHPDELHRREMAAGDRGAAGQSIARASRARVLRDASGWSAHAAGAAAQSAGQPHHGRARSGQPAAARRQRRQSSAGHLRAWDEAAGLSRRHSAASAARWRAASADALHGEWQGGHRSHPGSA